MLTQTINAKARLLLCQDLNDQPQNSVQTKLPVFMHVIQHFAELFSY